MNKSFLTNDSVGLVLLNQSALLEILQDEIWESPPDEFPGSGLYDEGGIEYMLLEPSWSDVNVMRLPLMTDAIIPGDLNAPPQKPETAQQSKLACVIGTKAMETRGRMRLRLIRSAIAFMRENEEFSEWQNMVWQDASVEFYCPDPDDRYSYTLSIWRFAARALKLDC